MVSNWIAAGNYVKKPQKPQIKHMGEGKDWSWWLCAVYNPDLDLHLAGGYLTLKGEIVVCNMSDNVQGTTTSEALVNAIGIVLQFITEDARINKEEISIVIDNKNIVDWLLGGETTCWELRFLRNKTQSMRDVVQNVDIKFSSSYEYKNKQQWVEKAITKVEKWVEWQDIS
ncbi:hypothetical protein PIB30_051903 [Stylosanthes scabra]|uniref:RNase H type-1 domain-containing protein n=1 Tax=Stylosanthes scabra TaxID=79078 RepID=A0ABU6YGL2_9FABA|nr:hypothetical protein [Stylosanthes scabra]